MLMAGMMTISTIGASTVQVFAADGPSVVVEDAEDASDDAASEAGSEDAASEASSEDAASEASSEEASTEESSEDASTEASSEEAATEESSDEASTEESVEDEDSDINDLVFFDRWNQSATYNNKLQFQKQYQEYCYDLGEAVAVENVNSVIVKVSKQAQNICIKLYDSSMTEKYANYGCNGSSQYAIIPTFDGDVKYVGIMSMPSDESVYPYGVTIDDVVVDKKETTEVKNEETLVFEGETLKFTERWGGTAVEGNTLEYDQEWREYFLSLGKEIAGDAIKSIKFTFAEPTKNLCFKAYGGGTELTQVYGQNGRSVYTYTPATVDNVDEIAIMAMNDQEFPFTVTVEKIEVVVDTTPASEKPEAGVEYDIVDLRDPVEALMGEDFIIGTAVSYDEFRDANDLALTTKHFNGVTLGNELKPDAMLKKGAEIVKKELNGEEIDFPELDFTTPEGRLDYFLDWNNEHPEKKIRVRGHVLVWHSQTPDFFFHEDYDTSKPYVTPDVMNKRLEVYIREVAQHFTGEGSKYAGMFYGWDVVNEAVSDGTGTYRNASENSTWWRVYQSPEFINNAFVYANRYMPAEVALFYNDYNDTTPNKVNGICQLIANVKATPGARIDGMGMQAHYQISNNDPSMEAFKTAAHRYAELVDQIQVTELDFKGSANSTDERLAQRYKAVYDTIRRLRNEGVNFTGMTIWGVTDKHSWLQTSNSVGGSADGRTRQYPLLFDDYYKAKNAFWALVDAGELEPEIKTVTLIQNANGDFSGGITYEVGKGDTVAYFTPMWSEAGLDIKVVVKDATVDELDGFTVYTSDDSGVIAINAQSRKDATPIEGGYESSFTIAESMDVLEANKLKLDVTLTDNETVYAFCDTTLNQAQSNKYYAETVIKPLASVKKGTVTVDGDVTDAAWETAREIPVSINNGAKATATAKILWDEENLYVLATVNDSVLNKDASDAWEQDSIEVFIDENNAKASSYQDDDKQYRINYENARSFNGKKCLDENVNSAAVVTADGYVIEAAFKWTDIAPEVGTKVGFDIQINDANESGKRVGYLNWADKTGNGWSAPSVFGTILLTAAEEVPTPEVPTPEVPEFKAELVTKWGATYYVAEDGTKLTGFYEIDGDIYYFAPDKGKMQKATWITVDDNKYYAKADGKIARNEMFTKWSAKYIVGEDGALQTGFVTFEGKDYYCKPDKGTVVISDWIDVDGNRYYAKNDGTLAKNETITKWFKKYTFDENGVLVK
jgi:endo-1,4-beta-xylanase